MIQRLMSKWPTPVGVWIQWFDQWIALLNAGLPLVDSLELSITMQSGLHSRGAMVNALRSSVVDLQAGVNLCSAFADHGRRVPPEICIALMCAQNTGDFAGQLRAHCDRWQRWLAARKALLNSLSYPLFVCLCALLCSWFLHNQPLLASATPESQPTDLYSASSVLSGVGLLSLLCLMPLWFNKRHAIHSKSLPLFGHWLPIKALASAQYFFLIACELEAGVDLIHSLRTRPLQHKVQLLGSSRQWQSLNRLATRLVRSIQRGQGLHQSCLNAGAPDLLSQQINVAQHTGQLAQAFHLTAKVCEAQALIQLKKLQAVAGPVLLALAGLTLALAYQHSIAPLYSQLGHM
ncbi:type II secretion system F family protein [Limnobacter litoralis]|uniref:Type II secretion system protein GspF domain-containing protein n=1 Tax=Limnobacter litoralis TaxID=481366 RepID=A0ABQ5YRX1_9BURK|nr:type II secretion system F family protein [Limnobacter litoralis]GLR27378.1 hypothetical protein GCM10007875_24690 [Limnobacter litoralis]